MGLWDRLKSAFSSATAPATGPRVLVINDLAFARTLPLRSKVSGRRRGEEPNCRCGSPFEEVILTTFHPEDLEAWRVWPLVVDGFRCPQCSNVALPRFLETDEFLALAGEAVAAARAGRQDEAEYGFRRMAASWTGYGPALSDLATALLQRANRLEDEGRCDLALLEEVESLLRDALALDAPPPRTYLVDLLAKAMLLRDRRPQAEDLVRRELESAPIADARSVLEALLVFVSTRGDMFERGYRLAKPIIQFTGEPVPFVDEARRMAGRRGVELLLAHASHAVADWRPLFFAALAQRTLGGLPTDLELLERAAARSPGQADVSKEHSLSLLRLVRHEDAVRVAEAAVAKNPENAECMSNLALCQLLAGQPAAAVETALRAVHLAPGDSINRSVLGLCEAVFAGKRPRPASLAELERGS